MMLQVKTKQESAVDTEVGHALGNKDVGRQLDSLSDPQKAKNSRHQSGEKHTDRDHWLHDFRNALGNVTIASSALRFEMSEERFEQANALMRQIEENCDRCLRLLGAMPR